MILSKLYSNKNSLFETIKFKKGLNIILGEIRNPKNFDKDTHNLGKSALAILINFCLLKGRSPKMFLFKHMDLFADFIFYLEIEYKSGKFLTIKRSVEHNSKISLKRHTSQFQDFTFLPDDEWTHSNIPIDRAKETLDSIFNLNVVKPWDYRMPVSYALRSQDDYSDVFQLSKFVKHIAWKPYLSKLLGLDSTLVQSHYLLKDKHEVAKTSVDILKKDIKGFIDSLDKLEGLILIKEEEATNVRKHLEDFDFEIEEGRVNKDLVYNIDKQLSSLNKERYYMTSSIEKLDSSLSKHKVVFNTVEAQLIFKEAGILFDGQIKKTYDELIDFNKDITIERKKYLKEELLTAKTELERIIKEINLLNTQRSNALKFLKDSGTIDKYKTLSMNLVELDSNILFLKKQEQKRIEYNKAKKELDEIKVEIDTNKVKILDNVNSNKTKESTYSKIKLKFNSIIKEILNKEALISIDQNKEGNLEFIDDFVDGTGKGTSERDGNTYKKFLCMAFDIAINQIYSDKNYTHFIYHDGFLETLDNRKKVKFLELIRSITQGNFQYIGTLIDSEIPEQDEPFLKDEEIILRLHDDVGGTLFKMKSF